MSSKNAKKYEKHQKLVAAIKETPGESKQAVREKWLTYCKTSFINEVMNWRLEIFKLHLSNREKTALKIRVSMRRSIEASKLNFRDQAGFLIKKYEHLVPKVDIMFPLLDPDMFWSDALLKH